MVLTKYKYNYNHVYNIFPRKKEKKHSNSFRSFSITHQLSVYFWALPFHIPSPNRVYVTPSSARKGSLEAAMSKLRIGVLPTSRPQAISLGRAGGMKELSCVAFFALEKSDGEKKQHIVDGRNPKKPPVMYKNYKTPTNLNWCRILSINSRGSSKINPKTNTAGSPEKMFPRKVEKEKHLQNQFVGSSR